MRIPTEVLSFFWISALQVNLLPLLSPLRVLPRWRDSLRVAQAPVQFAPCFDLLLPAFPSEAEPPFWGGGGGGGGGEPFCGLPLHRWQVDTILTAFSRPIFFLSRGHLQPWRVVLFTLMPHVFR